MRVCGGKNRKKVQDDDDDDARSVRACAHARHVQDAPTRHAFGAATRLAQPPSRQGGALKAGFATPRSKNHRRGGTQGLEPGGAAGGEAERGAGKGRQGKMQKEREERVRSPQAAAAAAATRRRATPHRHYVPRKKSRSIDGVALRRAREGRRGRTRTLLSLSLHTPRSRRAAVRAVGRTKAKKRRPGGGRDTCQ